MWAGVLSRSTSSPGFVWYQTIEIFPASPRFHVPTPVDAAAGVHRQVGVAEPFAFRRADRAGIECVQIVVALPRCAAVGRRPDVDLVAVVGDELEVAERRADDPVPVE